MHSFVLLAIATSAFALPAPLAPSVGLPPRFPAPSILPSLLGPIVSLVPHQLPALPPIPSILPSLLGPIVSIAPPAPPAPSILEEQTRLELEQETWASDANNIDDLVHAALEDFPEEKSKLEDVADAIARRNITDKTRAGHLHIVRAFVKFMLEENPNWTPEVNSQSPFEVRSFITKQCGPIADGCEGKKFATAVSIRAALTYFYKTLRPEENVTEWRVDRNLATCYGLPTRSPIVSQFMIGLEKTKAAACETSQSARALTLEDMHSLHQLCLEENGLSVAERRWGVVRYATYLLAWLLLLRIEEAVHLTFESIDFHPGCYYDIKLVTRKSAQTGVTHTWRLYANDADVQICPIHALLCLARLYGPEIPCTGPLFLKVNSSGGVLHNEPLTGAIVSRSLTKDMQSLGYCSWALYGTHSFRRRGCQYRLKHCQWTVGMLAAWGGWSQVEAITMFRYFYSPNDNHEHLHDYDRPEDSKNPCFKLESNFK
ncbi:hypothetical protein JB92DRAFT_3147445 [Gautieria morchelliformis]|nr:hypothetical protein JB92DRAFT_3147445 [Gautieria morchelliformis]